MSGAIDGLDPKMNRAGNGAGKPKLRSKDMARRVSISIRTGRLSNRIGHAAALVDAFRDQSSKRLAALKRTVKAAPGEDQNS